MTVSAGEAALADLDDLRVGTERPFGEAFDLGRQRGAKEKRLALVARRAFFHDALHVGQEAHVEHAVHLVEHEDFDASEGNLALLEVVEQAARGGDENIDAALEFVALLAVADAAVESGGAQVGEAGEVAEGFVHLHGELAGGFEDEDAGVALTAFFEAGEDRQREGGGFAGAGLGGTHEVLAGEHDGNRAFLMGVGSE